MERDDRIGEDEERNPCKKMQNSGTARNKRPSIFITK
jgi:hypothetical protein